MLNKDWSFIIREAQKSIIGLYLPGICFLGNQICRCNYHFWHCIPGCSPPHTDIPKNRQFHTSPWDNLQAEQGRLVTWKPCFVNLKLLVHRHDILWDLIIRRTGGSSWLPNQKKKKWGNKCLSNQAIHLIFGNWTWTLKDELLKRPRWCWERDCFSNVRYCCLDLIFSKDCFGCQAPHHPAEAWRWWTSTYVKVGHCPDSPWLYGNQK